MKKSHAAKLQLAPGSTQRATRGTQKRKRRPGPAFML
jgi:hypothetical protein